jgi:hypothetical protein
MEGVTHGAVPRARPALLGHIAPGTAFALRAMDGGPRRRFVVPVGIGIASLAAEMLTGLVIRITHDRHSTPRKFRNFAQGISRNRVVIALARPPRPFASWIRLLCTLTLVLPHNSPPHSKAANTAILKATTRKKRDGRDIWRLRPRVTRAATRAPRARNAGRYTAVTQRA